MSTPKLVRAFYERIWNKGDVADATELLASDFLFRASLGKEMKGLAEFQGYVCSVREVLAGYNCEILSCVAEGDQAFAKNALLRPSCRSLQRLSTYRPDRGMAGCSIVSIQRLP